MKDLKGQDVAVPKFKHTIKDSFKSALGSIGFDKGIIDGEFEKCIFFVLDGLGYERLGWLWKQLRMSVVEMGSTIPSVTPTALSTIFTGADPGEHGVIGIRFHLPEAGGGFYTLGFTDLQGFPVSIDPQKLLLKESLVTEFAREGADMTVVMPEHLENGLSSSLFHGAKAYFVPGLGGMHYGLSKFLRSRSDSMAIAYWEQPDMLLHHGLGKQSINAELNGIFSLIKKLRSQKLAKNTCLILVGDHGMVDIEKSGNIDAIKTHLREPPMGGSRHLNIYPKRGADIAGKINSYVLDGHDTLDKGFFGKAHEESHNRIGDLFLLAKGTNSLVPAKYPADHGSITRSEMSTAFAFTRLSDFNPLQL